MLKDKYITTKWNSRTKKYYEDLGYAFTKMKDDIIVLVKDLPKKSMEKVLIECDYCHKEFFVTWCSRTRSLENSPIQKDACTNCKTEKVKESLMLNFGVENLMQVPEYYNRQKLSCFEHYGVENPFQAEEVKQKIYEDNYDKYGVKLYTQTKEYLEKSRKTNLEKYGYENIMFHPDYKYRFRGIGSPVWKGGIHDERWDRLSLIYKNWRYNVFKRDNFICQKCLIHKPYLEAHHLFNYKNNIDIRYNVDNGITLCKECHRIFHNLFGIRNNTPDQINEFLQKR